jgi:tetratricopeptide (TPR) repeat protein
MIQFLKKENYSVSFKLSICNSKAITLLLFLFCSNIQKGFTNQANKIDSLFSELHNSKSDSKKAKLMLSIAKAYYPVEIKKSMNFAEQARIIFIDKENHHGVGESTNLKGAGYFAQGNFRKAETLFRSALLHGRLTNDSLLCGKILNNLANTKLNTGQLNDAVSLYTQAEKIFILTDNILGAISVENNLSSIYRTIGSYDKAKKHLLKALKMSKEEGNKQMMASVYLNLGSLLNEMCLYTEAKKAALEAYKLFLEVENVGQSVKVLITLGSIYSETNNFIASDSCYGKALLLSRKYGYIEDEAYTLLHLGYQRLTENDYKNASQYFNTSLEKAQQIQDVDLEIQVRDYLYYIDSIQENFQSALKHFQTSNTLKRNLSISESDSKLEELEKLMNLSKEENKMNEGTIRKNRTIIFTLIILLFLFAFIAIALVQYLSLKSQKKIAGLTQENLRSQMNPHFIFNVLNSIHSFILKNDVNSSSNYLIKFSHLLRLTLDNSVNKLVPIQDEIEALELYLELESLRMNNNLEYEINIDDEIDPIMFKIPTLLLQPYIENSVIHGLQDLDSKGKIEISLIYNNKNILCSIKDNGIGRKKAEDIKKQNGIRRKSHGTQITETRILLLNKIYGKKIGVHYYDILDENENCKGTCVEFSLPILN